MDNASMTTTVSRLASGECVFKVELQRRKGREMRRLRGNFTYEQFVSAVQGMWSRKPARIRIEYNDEDGDRVRVGSEVEWQEALVSAVDQSASCLRLFAHRPGVPITGESSSEDDETMQRKPTAAVAHVDPSASVAPTSPPPPATEADAKPTGSVATAAGPIVVDEDVPDVVEVPPPTSTLVAHSTENSLPQATSDPADTTGPTTASPASVPPVSTLPGPATLDLLSRLYDCDAGAEFEKDAGEPRCVDFAPVATRLGFRHWDVDLPSLHHLTVMRTNSWIEAGLLEKAEFTLGAALSLWPQDDVLEYNIACAASLRGDVDKAYTMLRSAIQHGFSNHSQLRNDPDLAALREHPEYTTLMRMAKSRSAGSDSRRSNSSGTSSGPSPPPPAPVSAAEALSPVAKLQALFPHLTHEHAASLLHANNNDITRAANAVLNL